ncbi:benzoate 4-monooxygenase cytochrome [Colletotrichum chrysophilum]|uniref:Benzoate 4-monooxygenase cytochrome n=1 Tax=Colletotrichum chrysophilum TaxID=1836956 RepID=A0AAD9ALH5_9PEZI|nr:benzoate 4-monooxygenase cytochrome [Colletotrichum chrysophilum]
MASVSVIVALVILAAFLAKYLVIDSLLLSPLRHVPGPKSFALTKWRLAYEDWRGTRTRTIHRLHQKYGPAVRIGPEEVSFNSLSALRTIYGPGSRYGRTSFYRMFDVYGRQNLFTFHSTQKHGERKRLLAHAYSKTNILKFPVSAMIEEKTRQYMFLIAQEPHLISETFRTLHYYSLDSITAFIYGKNGSTSALQGSKMDQALLDDILNPARRRLSWFAIHLPSLTKWLYTRTHTMERIVAQILPMAKPATYTGIRKFALEAYEQSRKEVNAAGNDSDAKTEDDTPRSIVDRLALQRKLGTMDDLDIASECADHFLAGIDTTSDTLMYLIWALSRKEHHVFQDKLRNEVLNLPPDSLNERGLPKAEASDKCQYLNAIIKETLRLYAPLPASEPRSLETESDIDGYTIPAHATVSMLPYSLHRNPEVFEEPLRFNPDRWLGPRAAEMNRWFWAFSSGGRMCIGLHLAMAEMTTLVAAIYRTYATSVVPEFDDFSPGITSRFELFFDDQFTKVMEHNCPIKFSTETDAPLKSEAP